MKLILHDLKNEYAGVLLPVADDNTAIFSALPVVKPCTSCFGCWLKTPGMCIIEDRAQDFMILLAQADELHIVSKMLYGGLSTEIKAVLDRSLGFILPYFDIKEGVMHHPPRYDNDIKMYYHMYPAYGSSISDSEIMIMNGIAAANARNLTAAEFTCEIYNDVNMIQGALK